MDKDLNNLLTGADDSSKSALALYEGVGESDLVSEEVDERILKLIGLDDVFDIDYGTYVSLLKERLVASRSFDKKLSSEEDELLVKEFKRVKGKVGRFKLKKRNITAESIGTTGPIQISRDKFFLASKAIVPTTPAPTQESSKDIKDIEKALDDILKSLTLQNKEKKKRTEEERKKSEDRRRRQREGDLEKPLTQLKSLAKKIIAPAQGILDRIFRFIKFTLLGYAFNQLVKWFSDPKNADKVKVLGRFLKDWWPSLLFAYGLFATPFGKFIRGTLKLLRGFIPQIARFLIKNPWIAGAVLMTTAGVVGIQQRKQKEEALFPEKDKQGKPIEKTTQQRVSEVQKKALIQIGDPMGAGPIGGTFSGGGLIRRKSFFGGGEVQKELDINQIAFAEGGGVDDSSGVRIRGAGSDTQLIAAAPGEVVMSKKAVDKYGANFFLDLNKKAGGTNIPKIANNIQLAAGGGLIKRTIKTFQGGGMVGNALNQLGRFLPGTGSVMAPNYTGMGYQNKFLGINLNRVNLPQVPGEQFSQSEVQRYNQSPTAPSTIRDWSPFDPVQVSVPKPKGTSGGSFVGDAFKNFGTNIQTIKGTAKRQEEMMRELGVKPSGYVNLRGQPMNIGPQSRLRGQPMNIGPQSRSVVPGPPVIISKTTFTVLPPIDVPSKSQSVPRTSELPSFNISANSDSRSNIAINLGIRDLVGV